MKKIKRIYEQHYKKLLFIPFLLVVLAIVQIGVQTATTGDFVNKGISLQGGSSVTLTKELSLSITDLESSLQSTFPDKEISVRTLTSGGSVVGTVVESAVQEQSEIEALLAEISLQTGVTQGELTVETIGSSLGESFFKQTLIALVIAFLLMGLVVFIYFRSPAPSMAVILAAVSDIVVTLAVFNLTGLKLSTAGIAAFLMLIGYSVDTDILLSTRVLKRKEGSIMERIYGAMKTGFTMSTTTIIVTFITLLFVQSDVVKQIMLILFIGLLVDLVMTWIQNVGILRIYLERKSR